MPLYEYECDACGQRFEKIQKFSDPPLEACAKCGTGPIRKLFSSPAIQFKGSGWYITDYASKGKDDAAATGKAAGGATAEGAAASDGTAKTDGTKADAPAKTESSPSTSSDAPVTTTKKE